RIREVALARRLIRRVFAAATEMRPVTTGLGRIVLAFGKRATLEGEVAGMRAGPDDESKALANLVTAQGLENEGLTDDALHRAGEAHRLSVRTEDLWTRSMAAQSIAELHSQSARPAQALAWTSEAIDGLRRFGAESDVARLKWMEVGNRIAAGDADGGTRLIAELETDGGENRPTAVWADMMSAEADLARGRVAEGLARYRNVVDTARTRNSLWWPTTVAAVLAAHALYGHGEQGWLAGLARSFRLRTLVSRRLMPDFVDK